MDWKCTKATTQNAIQKEEKHKKNIVEEWGFNEGQQPRHIGSPLVVQS